MSLNDTLNIACIPLDIKTGDVYANLKALGEKLEQLHPDADIVVLPELFSTGFVNDARQLQELAEPNSGETITLIGRWAQYYNVAFAGSFLARTTSHIYNRAFFIEPHGDEVYYDKHHLFNMSPEATLLTPGKIPPPRIRYRGWEISMVVCYDLRFPLWCRNSLRSGYFYDVLLVPANWPTERQYAWEHLLEARAIENQAYVVGANRSGADSFGDYADNTRIYDFLGKPIYTVDEASGIVYACCQRPKLDKAREAFPVLREADSPDDL